MSYKVLAPFNLPYVEIRKAPGETVTKAELDRYVKAAEKFNPDGHNMTLDETVEYFTKAGVLSDDMDAELHPDHQPVDPNAPTMASVVANAQFLVDQMKSRGQDVPSELKALASIEATDVSTGDSGNGGEKVAR